jgi:hypothetical protein
LTDDDCNGAGIEQQKVEKPVRIKLFRITPARRNTETALELAGVVAREVRGLVEGDGASLGRAIDLAELMIEPLAAYVVKEVRRRAAR